MRQQTNASLPLFTAPISSLIQLERESGVPLYQQICQKLREAILSGELAEGVRLPTERALAHELGVNRTTVMNAYNQLASEGLIEGHVGRGTLVRRNSYNHREREESFEDDIPSWLFGLPASELDLLGPDARILNELASMGEQKEVISLAAGTPAQNLLPVEMLRSILNDGLDSARQSALSYSPVEGLHSLRRGIAARMRKRGVIIDTSQILILSGSTQGIGLLGRLLLKPGDEVVVEVPTYLGAIQTFRALGARVIGVPTDNDGMRVDLLEIGTGASSPSPHLYPAHLSQPDRCRDVTRTPPPPVAARSSLPDAHPGRRPLWRDVLRGQTSPATQSTRQQRPGALSEHLLKAAGPGSARCLAGRA